MGLESKHPLYLPNLLDWEKMRDCYAGETVIKSKGFTYLPPTPAQIEDGVYRDTTAKGFKHYTAYKDRAVYHNFLNDAIKSMVGIMHHRDAEIQLPAKLEPMRDRGSVNNESLLLLLRRINEAQLSTGRIGLLLDIPSTKDEMRAFVDIPYIATYDAERIFNWDDGTLEYPVISTLNLVVLDESEQERTANFEWHFVRKHRVLVLGDVEADEPKGIYQQAFFRQQEEFDPSELMTPQIKGNTLNEIPFVFVNGTDLFPAPQTPPLLEVADICLAIYRGEASYRTHLFLQGQDTLVLTGANRKEGEELRVGAGAVIELPMGGTAEYVGVKSEGLAEERSCLENDKQRAGELGMKLLNTQSKKPESGEAMQTRVAAQTSTLNQIALAGAEGLQNILRIAAKWVGADPMEVVVKPNLDFADAGVTADEFLMLARAKSQYGLPITNEQLYNLMKKNQLTEEDFAQVQSQIESELAAMPKHTHNPQNPDNPVIQ